MRRLEFLFKEARESTNTTQVQSISDLVLTSYVNRVQSFIEDVLFNTNPNANIFRKQFDIAIVSGTDEYDMPSDCYGVNSTLNVSIAWGGSAKFFTPIDLLTEKERGYKRGYFLSRRKIVFSPNPTSSLACILSYTGKIPSLGLRSGKIKTASATSIKLEAGFKAGLTDEADFFCIVDANGVILQSALPLSAFTTGGTITTIGNTVLTVGNYIVLGNYATTNSQLPEECEKTILSTLEKMIAYRQSSTDFSVSSLISKDDIMMIKNVFESSISDSQRPPVTAWQEWVD